MFGFGSTTQHGIRVGTKDIWFDSESERDKSLKKMLKNAKKSNPPKKIQRTKPNSAKKANKCSGGSCKRNNVCAKHSREQVRGNADYNLYDARGRNKNLIRWDE